MNRCGVIRCALAGTVLLAIAPSCAREKHAAKGPVLCFGDSLTAGRGVKSGQDYPAVLGALTGRVVVNAGVPGELSDAGAQRLPRLLDEHQPSAVVILHGGNDLLSGRSDAQIERSIRLMVAVCRAQRVRVVLLGMPRPRGLFAIPDFYRRVADDCDLAYDGSIMREVYARGDVADDVIHLNAGGYRSVAEAVARQLE